MTLEETPDCCDAWAGMLHGFRWFLTTGPSPLAVMPNVNGWRVNHCPSCGAERRAVVVHPSRIAGLSPKDAT